MKGYQRAGVDLESASSWVKSIGEIAKSTYDDAVLSGVGGFSGLYRLGDLGMKRPVFSAGADGVGTKVKIAQALGKHDTVGIDLVAMNADDVVVSGARPLFFLDYIGVGKLAPGVVEILVEGVAQGCREAGCVLLGGETAQMPSIYAEGEYDLAGFCVGVVEEGKIIDGRCIESGDVLLGLASSGLHSNGFSLARKVFLEDAGLSLNRYLDDLGRTLGEELLEPTVIYSPHVLSLMDQVNIKGLAHITGGGIPGNVSRMLPKGLAMKLTKTWSLPPVFPLLQFLGGISDEEMMSVFNMGIGMVVALAQTQVDQAISVLKARGVRAYPIGTVVEED